MSNLIGLYPNSSGTLDGAPQLWSANTNDNNAAVIAAGYFTDKKEVMKGNDVVHIIHDAATTPALARGKITDTAGVLTFVPF